MATNYIDLSSITVSPKMVMELSKVISERMYDFGGLGDNVLIENGVSMKEQKMFASSFGETGIADTLAAWPTSDAKTTFSEKFIEPKNIGDTLVINASEINAQFQAYMTKINKYRELYDIQGTDMELFLTTKLLEAANRSFIRLMWHGDTAAASSGTASAGLISTLASEKAKFFTSTVGLWKRIFTDVGTTADKIKRVTISKNAQTTFANQALSLSTSYEAEEIFQSMWDSADIRLRMDPDARLLVSNSLYENYVQGLQKKGVPYKVELLTDGMPSVTWNGKPVVNMESNWELFTKAYFEQTSAHAADWLPHRAILTVKNNLFAGTIEEGSLRELKVWYSDDDRALKMFYGYSLDTLVLENYMTVVAY